MQHPGWYLRRLFAMSPGEVPWRFYSALRDRVDAVLLARRHRPRSVAAVALPGTPGDRPGFRVTDMPVGAWSSPGRRDERTWFDRLMRKADRILAHRLDLFDLKDLDLGDPIDWNRDYKASRTAPLVFSPRIDYRDYREVGDCKFVWEPNRHHQLVVLARAYRASGNLRYAAAVAEHLSAWLDANPYGVGMNWRSGLELAIRLINWVWAVDLIRESGAATGDLRDRLIDSVDRHIWEVARKYSRGSSANNHLIGEAAGVFIASAYFRDLRRAGRWRDRSRRILCREIRRQTHEDGGNREQAFGYHLFVMQFFLYAGLVGRWCGEDMPSEYWTTLEAMFAFAGTFLEGGATAPMYGDCDDGFVLDLGDDPRDTRALMATGAVLFGRSDLKQWSGGYTESTRWLLGDASRDRFEALPALPEHHPIRCRAFPGTGLYLLQSGRHAAPDRISIVFDCGELGFGAIAAHGHADALSFTLRAFGVDVLVDPGTYDYFTFPQWRAYFRSTRAHNTVLIDGTDQSVMLGPFLWGTRARARCISWEPGEQGGGRVIGEHDGYTRLPDPVHHRRTVELDGRNRLVSVVDELLGRGEHEVALAFHLAEHCRITDRQGGRFEVDVGPGSIRIEIDRALNAELMTGTENPIGGWVSHGYHQRIPTTTLVARAALRCPTCLRHRIAVG
jgi:hypothetical protein